VLCEYSKFRIESLLTPIFHLSNQQNQQTWSHLRQQQCGAIKTVEFV